MEVMEAIRSRRTIHLGFFLDKVVPDEIVGEVLDAARWAPSGANNQPCHFLVIKEDESRKWIVDHALEILALSGQIGRPPYRKALRTYGEYLATQNLVLPPVMVIVLAEQDKAETHVYDHGGLHIMAASAAVQNMMLAAWALGVGSTWLTFFDDVRVKAKFGIPTELAVAGIVLLGYPKAIPPVPPAMSTFGLRLRHKFEEIVHEETFDEERFARLRADDPYIHWLNEEHRVKRVEEENRLAREERAKMKSK